jgi:hypothetical protein
MQSTRMKPRLVPKVEPQQEERIEGMRVGTVVGLRAGGVLEVDFPGNLRGPLPARTTLALEEQVWRQAVRERQQAALFFDSRDPARPVVMGLIQPMPASADQEVELRCGKARVRLRPGEVVVECGKSSLRLQSNGQIELRGEDLVTEANGLHRIRGRKVKIN